MKKIKFLLFLSILWIICVAAALTCIALNCAEANAIDLDPQLELGIGYPIHNNRDFAEGNATGYVSATVRAFKWKWIEGRAGGYHVSDPTTSDAGTTWLGGSIRIGGD